MEPLPGILGVIGIGVLLTLVSVLLYWVFPLPYLTEKKETIYYRHEALIFFFIVYIIVSALFIPTWLLKTEDLCAIAINQTNSTSTTVLGVTSTATDYRYGKFCFSDSTDTINTLKRYSEYYSRVRYVFWIYLGVYAVASLFILIQNHLRKKEDGAN